MKKRLSLIIVTVLLLNSCALIKHNKINTVHDDFKNQETIILTHDKSAKPLDESKHIYKSSTIIWQKVKQKDSVITNFSLTINLALDEQLEQAFFIKTSNELLALKFNSINNTVFNTVKTEEEKHTTTNDSLQTSNTTVNTTRHQYDYLKTKAKTPLKNTILKAIKTTETLAIRFYIDEKGYTVTLSKKELDRLKELLQL